MTMKGLDYGRCFLIYLIVFLAFFANACFHGRVLSPVRQAELVGLENPISAPQIENPKFSDYGTYGVPEATAFLEGKRSGWITTWTPYNELGRPTAHLSGISPAYLPNWFLSKLTDDPFKYVSTIAALAMFLAGAFAFLLALELALAPSAALVAAFAIGLSPTLIYWATFPMFAFAYGFTTGAMYGLARLIRRPDLLAWLILAFSTYSLLMAAYPVMVVYNAYLGVGFFIYLARRKSLLTRSRREQILLVASIASAVAFGVLAALPALIDTFHNTLQSARTHPDIGFFRAAILPLKSVADWSRFLAFWTFAQVGGNPASQSFPPQFIGRTIAPLAIFLLCLPAWRRAWGWWLAALVLIVMEASPAAFEFAVTYLGIGISRSVPTVIAIIPLAMIAATNLDFYLRRPSRTTSDWLLPLSIAALLYALLLANSVWVAKVFGLHIDRRALIAFAVYLPVMLLALRFCLPGVLIAVAVAHLVFFDQHMLLLQEREKIAQSTPATERLRSLLPDSSRFATFPTAAAFLPPNLNAQVLLASVHSYDSLSPLRYQALIKRLGGEVVVFGRINTSISPDAIGTPDFQLANIGAVITRDPLESTEVVLDSKFNGFLLYKVLQRWGAFTTFDLNAVTIDGHSADVGHNSPSGDLTSAVVSNQSDQIDLRLSYATEKPTLLVASQSYNTDWHAEARSENGWKPLETLTVNGAYEGAIIPTDVDAIRLSFKPWVRWAWLGHVAFCILAFITALKAIRRQYLRRRLSES